MNPKFIFNIELFHLKEQVLHITSNKNYESNGFSEQNNKTLI